MIFWLNSEGASFPIDAKLWIASLNASAPSRKAGCTFVFQEFWSAFLIFEKVYYSNMSRLVSFLKFHAAEGHEVGPLTSLTVDKPSCTVELHETPIDET